VVLFDNIRFIYSKSIKGNRGTTFSLNQYPQFSPLFFVLFWKGPSSSFWSLLPFPPFFSPWSELPLHPPFAVTAGLEKPDGSRLGKPYKLVASLCPLFLSSSFHVSRQSIQAEWPHCIVTGFFIIFQHIEQLSTPDIFSTRSLWTVRWNNWYNISLTTHGLKNYPVQYQAAHLYP